MQAAQGDPESIWELENQPTLPDYGAHLWGYFLALHATRQGGGMGAPPRLSRLEIRLWEQDEGVTLERWERRAIMAVDAAWVRSVSEEIASKTPKEA